MMVQHLLGPSVPTCKLGLLDIFAQRKEYVFAFLVGVIILSGAPQSPTTIFGLPSNLVTWGACALLFCPMYALAEKSLVRMATLLHWKTLPEILISATCLGLISLAEHAVVSAAGKPVVADADFVFGKIYLFMSMQIGLYFYMKYVCASGGEDKEAARRESFPEVSGPRGFVADTGISFDSLSMIRAHGAMTHIYGRGGDCEITREKFSDVVSRLPAHLGFAIHRSIWISGNLARNWGREGRRHFVVLPSGIKLPIARGRRREFRDWLEANLDEARTR